MEFKEPKVEIIKVEIKGVVYASGEAGVESCMGSGSSPITGCPDDYV